MALKPLFPIQQAQHAQACAILQALCWSLQHQQVCHFSSTHSVLVTLFSPPSFLLPQPLSHTWQELSSLSSCSFRLQWVPRHSFLPGKDAADELARQGVLLMPGAIPCSVSPLISHFHSSLFLDWRHIFSLKFFYTQVSLISTEELVLPCHSCNVLSHLCCNKHSLLLSSYLSRIGRIKKLSCSTCGQLSQDTSHLILLCSVMDSLAVLCLFTTSVQALGSSLASEALWVLPCPIPQKESGKNNNNFSVAVKNF